MKETKCGFDFEICEADLGNHAPIETAQTVVMQIYWQLYHTVAEGIQIIGMSYPKIDKRKRLCFKIYTDPDSEDRAQARSERIEKKIAQHAELILGKITAMQDKLNDVYTEVRSQLEELKYESYPEDSGDEDEEPSPIETKEPDEENKTES